MKNNFLPEKTRTFPSQLPRLNALSKFQFKITAKSINLGNVSFFHYWRICITTAHTGFEGKAFRY